ncbi:F-box protein, partial [Mucuna pruriens]
MAMCPNELFEVFSYLPTKAIYRFKCINNSVSKLLEETYFATKQVENSIKEDDTCFFLQQVTSEMYSGKVKLFTLPGNQSSFGLSGDVLRFLSKGIKVLSSTNGLILCRSTNKIPNEFFICNPATKSWLPIPSPEQVQERPNANLIMVLLKCSNRCDDYSVVHFEPPRDWSSYYACKIFKPKEGLWKTMKISFFTGGRNMNFNTFAHCNGVIHFISDCSPYLTKRSSSFRPYIMSYHLENGTSTMLRVPRDARRGSHDSNCDMSIFNWGKVSTPHSSICLVRLRKSVFTIWILTDYESDRWKRILKVRTKGMGLKEKDPKITGYTVMNGDALVFATETRIYSYGLTYEKYMTVEEICENRWESNGQISVQVWDLGPP